MPAWRRKLRFVAAGWSRCAGFSSCLTHLPDSIMKFFTYDAKFAEAGRDPAALENLLAWHRRQRKVFVALLVFFFCAGVALVVAGGIFFMPVWHFLHEGGGKAPDLPLGLNASVISSFGMVFLSLVLGTGIAFRHNEACIKMLLLQRGARSAQPASGTP